LVKNHTACSSLKNRTLIEVRTGQTPDVSKLLQYRWWEPVYFLDEEGTECLGRWAGVAEHVGDELTFIVVSDKTGHAILRSDLRTATDPNAPNFRAETIAVDHLASSGAQDPGSVFSPIGLLPEVGEVERVYPYAPDDLVGKTFVREDQSTGDFIRYEIVRMLKKESEATKEKLQYLVENRNGDQSTEEVMDYTELCDIVEAQIEAVDNGESGGLLTFKSILAHQGLLSVRNPQYKGSAWNILVEWDVGNPTWEPLNLIAKCDPVLVAMYGEANGLLNKKGWKYLKKHAKNMRKVYCHVQEIMRAQLSDGPKYKYGTRLPDKHKTCAELDSKNGNSKWQEATQVELDLLDEFKAFEDMGIFTTELAKKLIDKGYQFIKLMMVYDVKHDGRYRARLVAAGNMTKPSCDA
jgi:hypothetical protein